MVTATGTSMSVLGRAMNLNTVQARRTGAWHGLSPHSDTRMSNSCRVQQCYGDYETGGLVLGLGYTLTLKLELDSVFRR